MSVITLTWDNTAVNASPNATGQRASKRIKAVGGAWITVGFNPANDLPKSANTTDATVDDNRVYEFKVEGLCSSGGPTIDSNGVIEGIVFACINPVITPSHNGATIVLNVLNTDIEKARFVIRRAADDVIHATVLQARVGNSITANITGLAPSTNYYIEIELYATVNGVEVVSSSAAYLGEVCGGNVVNYQFATTANPACPAPQNLVVGPLP